MSDINDLVYAAVADAQVIFGERLTTLTDARALPTQRSASRNRARPWTEAENEFYMAHAGAMSLEEIGEHLGRTRNAVEIHFTRTGMPAPSKMPGWLTAQKISNLLSLDNHKTAGWIDAGIMPGTKMEYMGRTIRRVSLVAFKRWLTRPTNWVYFDVNLVKNHSLRRLVQLAQERWGDEWWSTRQVADYHRSTVKDITRLIKAGKLAGFNAKCMGGRSEDQRWAYWYVRKSDALKLVVPRGKGHNHAVIWSPRADAYMLRARADGEEFVVIAKKMGWSVKRVMYRYKALTHVDHVRSDGSIQPILAGIR